MEIRDLGNCDFDTLFRGFERAFEDYEIRFEKEEVRSMLKRRGYNPGLSFAFFEGDDIVAFTLNGIGLYNGIPTAYDTGTGTAKEYRGRGLAGKIFDYSIPFLKYFGIRQYVLEVLQNNDRAISVYDKMGFEVVRELWCYRQSLNRVKAAPGCDCVIESIDIESVSHAQYYCDFSPSWQNGMESIRRGHAGLTCLGAFIDGDMAGYCVFDSMTGDLTQIAVKREFRRRGIATRLLHEVLPRVKTDYLKVLNIDPTDKTVPAFLESRNIELSGKQLEMRRVLI